MMGESGLQPFRDLTRRGWLRLGALSVGKLVSSQLQGAERADRLVPSARSCVLFVLQGGPSQLDIWDLKPTTPVEVRGPFRPASTSVPGVQFVEYLPRLARVAHLFTIVRSMSHKTVFHHAAGYQALSGQQPLRDGTVQSTGLTDHPHPGAILALKRPSSPELPTAVSLPNTIEEGFHPIPAQGGGFLGGRYAPFAVNADPNDPTFSVAGLEGEQGRKTLSDRRALLRKVNRARDWLAEGHSAGQIEACQQRALDLLSSGAARKAFALRSEPSRLRDRYGRHKAGQSLLLARRLVEAGVGLVTVYWGGRLNKPLPYWDTHEDLEVRLKDELLPPFDQCFSAFLEDLESRGLLKTTLVVCLGEFGRTPRMGQFTGNGANPTGRDHWPHCYSLLVAGGRAGGGRVIGRSDRRGAYPADDPIAPQDVTATLLHDLGVNPRDPVRDAFGRMVPLCSGRVIPKLFGT
jgi:hypothetical protein